MMKDDVGPLTEVLRRGEADPELQAWIADQIERSRNGRGGFASRKSWHKRMGDLGRLYDALVDVPKLQQLLRAHGRRKGARERAKTLAAVHWIVPLEHVVRYLRRGKKDRHHIDIWDI